ncbi:MAG: dethiobiotin synthase [Bacteroidetes bacterium]|nr:MAG: dethiobiotin synthase [Bacteroidota bacterium]
MQPIFVTGIGTGIGKTFVSAIVAEALEADYWKPVQAGFDPSTDSERIRDWVTNPHTMIHPELYKLKLAASPHISARDENLRIDLNIIRDRCEEIVESRSIGQKEKSKQDKLEKRPLIVEGAGGLLVPLNEDEFVLDLVKKLNARVILVSRNYLGSINHSLLTARICAIENIPVVGWIFNDQFMHYEEEIQHWSGFPRIGSIPFLPDPGRNEVKNLAANLQSALIQHLAM